MESSISLISLLEHFILCVVGSRKTHHSKPSSTNDYNKQKPKLQGMAEYLHSRHTCWQCQKQSKGYACSKSIAIGPQRKDGWTIDDYKQSIKHWLPTTYGSRARANAWLSTTYDKMKKKLNFFLAITRFRVYCVYIVLLTINFICALLVYGGKK